MYMIRIFVIVAVLASLLSACGSMGCGGAKKRDGICRVGDLGDPF